MGEAKRCKATMGGDTSKRGSGLASFAQSVVGKSMLMRMRHGGDCGIGDTVTHLVAEAIVTGAECYSIPSAVAEAACNVSTGPFWLLEAVKGLKVPEHGIWIELPHDGPSRDGEARVTGTLVARAPEIAPDALRLFTLHERHDGKLAMARTAITIRPSGDPRPPDRTPAQWATRRAEAERDVMRRAMPEVERAATAEYADRVQIGMLGQVVAPGVHPLDQDELDAVEGRTHLALSTLRLLAEGRFEVERFGDSPVMTRLRALRAPGVEVRAELSEPTARLSMSLLRVGEQIPPDWHALYMGIDRRQGGGALALGRDPGVVLLTGFPNMSHAEALAARKAPVEIGLLRHGDALFLVVRVEGYATLDLPYDHTLPPPEQRGLPNREANQGFVVNLHCVDTRTGVLRAMRMVSVTPEFSAVLEAEIRHLDGRVGAPNWNYARDVEAAYRRWPTPNAMLRASRYRETAGMPFPHERIAAPTPNMH